MLSSTRCSGQRLERRMGSRGAAAASFAMAAGGRGDVRVRAPWIELSVGWARKKSSERPDTRGRSPLPDFC